MASCAFACPAEGGLLFRRRAVVVAIVAFVTLSASAQAAPLTRRVHGSATAAPARAAAPALAEPGVGARSAGDELFPTLGNGGYDAKHYALDLSYLPGVHLLSGTTTLTATATQPLREFSLDFQGFTISAVTVDGVPATYTRQDTKLIVDPATPLAQGQSFAVAVTYLGQPPSITDPDGSSEGFLQTADGAFVVCEPAGAQGWFPNNNTPSDKATFDITMAVPTGLSVLANGVLVSNEAAGPLTSWHWREDEPMATYLSTASLGLFDVARSTGPDGEDIYTAVDPAYSAVDTARSDKTLSRIPEILTFLDGLYGPYPFKAAGAIVDVAPTVGYALETQTKPNFPLPPGSVTLAHETSHQWFGDSVSLTQWRDIWLNEGFATWSQWVFDERRNGGSTTRADYESVYATDASSSFWQIPPADPGSGANIFSSAVYDRGGATLEALREIVGEPTFLRIMRTWVAQHRQANATTAQFIALAKSVSGRDLDAFFQQWLYAPSKPTITPDNFSG